MTVRDRVVEAACACGGNGTEAGSGGRWFTLARAAPGGRVEPRAYSKTVTLFTTFSTRSTLPHLAQFHVGGFSWLRNSMFAPGWHVFGGIFVFTSTRRPKSLVTLFLDFVSLYRFVTVVLINLPDF